jgi:hypothetical protein
MSWDRGYHPIADTRALEVPPPQGGARVSPARSLLKQAPRFLIGHDPADKLVRQADPQVLQRPPRERAGTDCSRHYTTQFGCC